MRSDADYLAQLPLTLWYLSDTEALNDLNPEVNPNRNGMPGAQPQHAVRVRYQYSPPTVTSNGQTVTVQQADLQGWTFLNGEPLSNINLDALVDPESPDTTAVCEVYPDAVGSQAISWGTDGAFQTSVNPSDALLTDVNGVQAIVSGADNVFQSVRCDLQPNCNDFWTEIYNSQCTGSISPVLLSQSDLVTLRKIDVAHEVGHGFDINHNATECDSIMAQFAWLPLPTIFTGVDSSQIRLHRKH